MEKHWHVVEGFIGCYPETNVAYKDKDEAREHLAEILEIWVEMGEKFEALDVDKEEGYYYYVFANRPHSTYHVKMFPCTDDGDVCLEAV